MLCSISLIGNLSAQVSLSLYPEASHRSFTLPARLTFQHASGLTLVHQSRGYHLDHSHQNYLWRRSSRHDLTVISEISYFAFSNKDVALGFGRNYLMSGPGKFSGLFLSPIAPSTDHAHIGLKFLSSLQYDYFIIRLDNRRTIIDGAEATIQRWYYLRRLSFRIFKRLEIGLKDAVVATGRDRDLEWTFLNPFAVFAFEQLHEESRTEGLTPGPAGTGNNENQFIGFDWRLQFKNITLYNEWLIDEFQVDVEDRDQFQDVFGTIWGIQISASPWNFVFEYAYASPWLYLNRGLFTAPERHELPLGLRSPHSHSLDVNIQRALAPHRSIQAHVHFEQRGDQTITTPWDNYNNKIGYFDFEDALPLEIKVVYTDSKAKFFDHLGFYQSWLGSDTTQFIIGWNLEFN
ncbi:capsule assembly Wzi family protein [bacterium]|nr:capsule assembly Wzi family protein [bacterium]